MLTNSLSKSKDKDSNLLDVKVKNYTDCGFCDDEANKIILTIPWEIYSKWLYLSNQMGNKEWGGVFTVKDKTVTDFKIPKQEIASAEVEFMEDPGGNGIVHSHHDMGAFHSHQDDKHARNLFEYSIVIAHQGYTASKRIKLPCGAFGYLNVELQLINAPQMDLSRLKEKKLTKSKSPDQPDLPEIEADLALEDSPCMKCTTYRCDECNLPIPVSYECRCFYCNSLKCRNCKHNLDNQQLPFCEFCEEPSNCNFCGKLEKYFENYPEERQYFEIS